MATSPARPGQSIDGRPSYDDLVSLLAHDARSPLGPLSLALSALLDDEALTGDSRELVEISQSMAGRVRRLLAAAVLPFRGEPPIHRERVHLADVVVPVLEEFRALGGQATASVVDVPVSVDATLLPDALLGLLESLASSNLELDTSDGPDEVRIRITKLERGSPLAGEVASPFLNVAARTVVAAGGGSIQEAESGLVVRLPKAS